MGLIRALLAISVILAHSESFLGFYLVGGKIAVQAFFIISGFYMALILNEKYIGGNSNYGLFISNRFLRIYPIYYTVFILVIATSLLGYFYRGQLGVFRCYVAYYSVIDVSTITFLIISNLSLFFQDMILFLGLNPHTGMLFFSPHFTEPRLHYFMIIPQAWSISIELMFYLIAPFIARKKVSYIALLAAISLSVRIFLYKQGYQNDPWNYRFFFSELFFFFLGIIAYHIYKMLSTKKFVSKINQYIYIYILIALTIYSLLPLQEELKSFIFLSTFFLALPFIFILSKKWKIDRYIGDLSYPMYISHVFVLSVLGALKIVPSEWYGEIGTLCTILFSILLNELVAKKIEAYRQKRLHPQQ